MKISNPTSLSNFNPKAIPYQFEVLKLLRVDWDYSKGTPEVLLSGSFGSGKSLLLAHLIITHCLMYPRACVCIARKALPDIKRTIFAEILEHLSEDLIEGVHYWKNETNASIRFANGAQIISASWSDKRYMKFRSLKLSMLVIEEIVENNQDDMEAFKQLKARLRRIPEMQGKENVLIAATNPDSPAHWVYDYFIESKSKTRMVFYSITTDNPFLDPIYIYQLKEDLDPKEAQRYIYGQWIELATEVIYYAYDKELNHRDYEYKVDCNYPIHCSWDFNIGHGKPMSMCLLQYIDDTFHIFNEVILEGMRTLDICEELASRCLLDYPTKYIINGDATGRARDTRSIKSDYDILKKFFANYKLENNGRMDFETKVPLANPPIRTRHSKVNAYCLNDNNKRRLFTYKLAPTCKKGLSLAQLKKGGQYIEDDSKEYQHVTTAIGYSIVKTLKDVKKKRSSSRDG